jgi:hypothetical protein
VFGRRDDAHPTSDEEEPVKKVFELLLCILHPIAVVLI